MPRSAQLLVVAVALALIVPRGGAARAADDWVSVAGQLSLFGLFNVDQELTLADPGFGVVPAWEHELGAVVSVGAEVLLAWVRSEVGREHHLIVSPAARVRLRFAVGELVEVELLVALGLTVWPESEAEAALHPALSETRLGWSARVAGGVSLRIDERWSIFVDVGYAVSSTWRDEVAATVDGLVLNVGPRLRL